MTNLDTQSSCLLGKWLFKLLTEEGTWQLLLKRKYLSNKTLAQVTKTVRRFPVLVWFNGDKRAFLSKRKISS
jgi:hypothetical protein